MPIQFNRQSIRLSGYNYESSGYYFVTICTTKHKSLFGDIVNGKMILNQEGEIVSINWLKTLKIRKNVKLEEWVIMPNHIHGILIINNHNNILNDNDKCFYKYSNVKKMFKSPSNTIGSIIRGFKSSVTKEVRQLYDRPQMKIWQRNYHDHIIRNENEYYKISSYIRNNPQNWKHDCFN